LLQKCEPPPPAGFRHTNSHIISRVVVLNLGSLDQLHNLQQISVAPTAQKKNLAKCDQYFKNIRRQNPFGVTFTSDPALTPFLINNESPMGPA
jgi:hypothetical protein